MSNVVAFIPARSGSKAIKHKNIKELGGKPLLAYSIDTGIKLGLRTIVNTDSKQYAKIAQKYGAETMLRPKELAQDNTSMFETLQTEIPKINPVPEYVLLLQPTTPFCSLDKIKEAIAYMLYNPDCDSVILVERVPEKYEPEQVIVNTEQGLKMADGRKIPERVTQRQQHKEAWIPTGTYIFRASNLKEGNMYGDNTKIIEVEPTANINTPQEWEEAEEYVKHNS